MNNHLLSIVGLVLATVGLLLVAGLPAALAAPEVTNCATQTQLPKAECDTLVAFYTSTGGPTWSDSPDNRWNRTQTPCTWWGVSCSSASPRHVTSIWLWSDNLVGPLPDLSALTQLQTLYLPNNQLSGSIPNLSALTQLQTLYLSNNQLSGTITWLSTLTRLQQLDLSSNELSGTVPSLANLRDLSYLALNHNQLSGSLPNLAALTGLFHADLRQNRFTGTIPDLSGLTGLDYYHYLYLSENQLTGTLPAGLCNVLWGEVNLNYNMLSGDYPGCFPDTSPGWASSQTVPPTDLAAYAMGSGSIHLSWTPIRYAWDGGYYEVLCGAKSGGPYTSLGKTAGSGGKNASSLTVTGLTPGARYYCVARTFTPAHYSGSWDAFQQNDLTSAFSVEVAATTGPAVTTNCAAQTDIPRSECEALVALYNNTGGPNWYDSPGSGWNRNQNPCSWSGVTCSAAMPHRVTQINRWSNHLAGTLPDLSSLANLEVLDLSGNQLSGSLPNLSSLTRLTLLNLQHNRLSGAFPNFAALTSLQSLDLSGNQLGGTVPNLAPLANLVYLRLGGNQLDGPLPALSALTRLQTVDLSGNRFTGAIPDVSALSELRYLFLDANRLTGVLPPGLCNVKVRADLSYNMLSGDDPACLPDTLWDWRQTQTVPPNDVRIYAVPDNGLELDWTPIPYDGGDGYYEVLCGSKAGGPYSARGTTISTGGKGSSTFTLTGLTANATYHCVVRTFTPRHDGQQNDLTSAYSAEAFATAGSPVSTNCATQTEIPKSECAALVALYNSTGGPGWSDSPGNGWNRDQHPCSWTGVSCSTGTSRHVTMIHREVNNLVGTLPDLFALTRLQVLDLHSNQLSGTIPDLSALTNLQGLDLSSNQLSGTILSLSGLANLQGVDLSSNQLSGTIPSLSGLANLQWLNLSYNQLSGTIPSLSGLASLQGLALTYNQLSGTIPSLSRLTNLQTLALGNNRLSGVVPDLSPLTKLIYLRLGGNQLSGSLPNLSVLTKVQQVDLSRNRFGGPIPDLSALIELQYLFLSENQLSGPLPPSLCQFTGGVNLDYNMLSAEKPDCLGDYEWISTQTLPPTGLAIQAVSATSILLSWTPIPYYWDGGYYEVLCGDKRGGPYTSRGTTENTGGPYATGGKFATGFTVNDLTPGAQVYCVARTFTPAHYGGDYDIFQQNDLTSAFSVEVSVRIPPPASTICATQTQIPKAECDTLVALYNSTGGPSWSDSPGNGWNRTQTPCAWTGIECSSGSPRHVTAIDRQGMNLIGTLPDLSALVGLRVLDLDYNVVLSGSLPKLPDSSSLERVELTSVQLTGTVPDLSRFTKLRVLSLGGHLSGPLPNLSALTRLEHVNLSCARFSGQIPDLSKLSQLQELFLNGNQLSGPLPPGLCNAKGRVDLNYNMFTGDYPDCFPDTGNWRDTQTVPPTNVIAYGLSATGFQLGWTPIRYTGDLGYYEVLCSDKHGGPYTSMGTTEANGGKNASGLAVSGLATGARRYCVVRTVTPGYLWDNCLQNDRTSIFSAEVVAVAGPPVPTNCATQTQIPRAECETLVALFNNTGGPNWSDNPGNRWNLDQNPCSWAGVTCSAGTPGHVTKIERRSDNLVGTLPDLSALVQLEVLDLSWNQLGGNLPSLSALTGLKSLNLSSNHLTGPIPNLTALTKLEGVDLSINRFSGAVPDLPALAHPGGFYAGYNQLAGLFPQEVCKSSTWYFDLGYNMLSGDVPPCRPWGEETQTVPPRDVSANALSPASVQLAWTPILYRGDWGYYEVLCGAKHGGPYTSRGTTEASGGKDAASFTLNGLTAGAQVYCVVRTFTAAHGSPEYGDYQQNDLTSAYSAEVAFAAGPTTPTNCKSQTQIPQAECETLLALYNSTGGPSWSDSPGNGWNQNQAPCFWAGVACSADSPRRVIDITRLGDHLVGTLPDLSALTALQGLDLSANHLSGPIPNLTALASLESLSLGNNHLSGVIPNLYGLGKLNKIDLSGNEISGAIPNLSALPLGGLYLDSNRLSGPIPTWMCTIGPWAVWVDYNMLTGASPDCGWEDDENPDWAATQTVPPAGLAATALSDTRFQLTWTPIPYTVDGGHYEVLCGTKPGGPYTSVGTTAAGDGKSASSFVVTSLPHGAQVYCVVRTFTPAHFQDSVNQQNNLMSENSEEVAVTVAAPAPTNCAAQAQVPKAECEALLALYNGTGGPTWSDSPANGWNRSQAPCAWTGVTCSTGTARHITAIDRQEKHLAGPLPDLSALIGLRVLNLDLNDLSGGVPRLPASGALEEIYLSRNHLTGTVPDLTGYPNLKVLSLGGSQLTGPLPKLSMLAKLVHVDLSRARFTGTIPDLSVLTQLQELFLNENQLAGPLPPGLCNAKGRVDLNYNMLSGDYPACFPDTDPGWAHSQTVPPTDITASALSATSFQLAWTPIPYTGDGGYYEVLCGSMPGGPYASQGTTAASGGKSAASFTVTGVAPGVQEYCVVRTFTPAHLDQPVAGISQQNDLASVFSAEVVAPAFYNGGENRLGVDGWRFDTRSPGVTGAMSAGVLRVDVPGGSASGPASACWSQDLDGAALAGKAVRFEAEMHKSDVMNAASPPFTNPYIALNVRRSDGSWVYNYGGILHARAQPNGPWISEARDIVLPIDMTTLRAAFCVWNASAGTAEARYPLLRLITAPPVSPPPTTNLLTLEWTWAPATEGISGGRTGGAMSIGVTAAPAQGCWIQELAGAPLQGKTVRFQGAMSKSDTLDTAKGFVNPYISLQVRQTDGHWLYNYGGILNSRAVPGGPFVTESGRIALPADMQMLRAAFCVWQATPGTANGKDITLQVTAAAQEEAPPAASTWDEAGPDTPSLLPDDSITEPEGPAPQPEDANQVWLPSLRR